MNCREHQRTASAVVYFKSQLDALIRQYQSDSLASSNNLLGLEVMQRWIQFSALQQVHLCSCIGKMLEECSVCHVDYFSLQKIVSKCLR